MRRIILSLLLLASVPVVAQQRERHFEVMKNLNVLCDIYKNLDLMYVDTLDAKEVLGNGIDAILRSLDPYSEYYSEEDNDQLKELYTGSFAGIGALIKYAPKLKSVIIDEPYEDTPAARAGLKKGDVIVSIDGASMYDKDVKYVSSHLRGDAGTTFVLAIRRPVGGKEMKEMKVKITRQLIKTPAIPYYGMLSPQDGIIVLNRFTDGCSQEMRRAVVDLKKRGMTRLVLDLRGNGGGSEKEAVNILGLFLPKGLKVVSNRGRLPKVNHDFYTNVEPVDTLMPMVVLVDGNSASSSEIVSGSLQDLDRAVIMGSRTYGKGLVQTTVDVPYGGHLKFTTHKYYIPSGRCIQALNYSHDRKHFVEHVPDSLTKVFYTRNGREVRDGGGILPDVVLVPDTLPNIIYYINYVDSNMVMTDFVVDYIAHHPTIAAPDKFSLSDADYEAFKTALLNSGFRYDRESGKMLQKLKKVAVFEGYYEDAKKEFADLEKKLAHNLSHDLDFNKEAIRRLLEQEIVAAYYYRRGFMEHALCYDKQSKEAVKLLDDQPRYKQLLQGPSRKKK